MRSTEQVSVEKHHIEALLLEDSDADAVVVQNELADNPLLDVTITHALRLADALPTLQRGLCDVVLADLDLPDSKGLSTFEKLRAAAQDVPVIVLTGQDDSQMAATILRQGAEDYLTKGKGASLVLARAIRHAIERNRSKTELNRHVQRLAELERRDRNIIESSADAIVIVDTDGIVRFVNPAAEQMFKRRANQFIGHPFGFPVTGNHAAKPAELDFVAADGTPGIAGMHVVDIEWEGAPAYLASLRDITSRVRTETQLKNALARLRAVLASAPLFIWALDRNGMITVSEGQLLERVNLNSQDLVGRTLIALYADQPKIVDMTRRALSGQSIHETIEFRGLAVETWYTPIADESNQFVGTIGVGIDVTDRVRAEALQKFESVGRLAGGIAHDFNNALGVILGWADLALAEAPADSRIRDRLEKICRQARHAAGLTAQLLAFARRQVLQPKILSLNDMVSDINKLLGAALGERIDFATICAPDVHSVRADPTQIEQVLINLCINARDAMPRGGRLVVETRNVEVGQEFRDRHSYGSPGSYVLLSVSDTGTGMDAATLSHIFEPFFTTKEPGKGTGLGLATVYGIVKQHEGFVNVYSEPGHGTTFRVYLPAVGEPADSARSKTDQAWKGNETILVVEDNEALREVASTILAAAGYRVILASDGEEGVRVFTEHQEAIGVVVLDVIMPRLTGQEAYSRVSAIKPGIPVVFTSGHTEESLSMSASIEAGASYLQKPYSPKTLCQAVRAALDRPRHV
jgi:signal transduction histidine kinase/DNA-binding response OmpR family regulator